MFSENNKYHISFLLVSSKKKKKQEKNEIMLGLQFGTKAGKFFESHDSGYMLHRTGDGESKLQNQSFCYSALTLRGEVKKKLKPERFSDLLISHKQLTRELLNIFQLGARMICFCFWNGNFKISYEMK